MTLDRAEFIDPDFSTMRKKLQIFNPWLLLLAKVCFFKKKGNAEI